MSKLNVAPVRLGLMAWAVNLMLRRPADFPTFEWARFRREIVQQASRAQLSSADIAVVKFRERLLSSSIDARFSKPLTAADPDRVTSDVVAAAEFEHDVTFNSDAIEQVADAVWKQYADFFGSPAIGRARQVAASEGFVPASGSALAARLRELEAQAVVTMRANPKRR